MIDKSNDQERHRDNQEYEVVKLDQSPAFALHLKPNFHQTIEKLQSTINTLRAKGYIVHSDSEGSQLWGFCPSLSQKVSNELAHYGVCALGQASDKSPSFLLRKPDQNAPVISGCQSVVNAFRGLSQQLKENQVTPHVWSQAENGEVKIKGQTFIGNTVPQSPVNEHSNWKHLPPDLFEQMGKLDAEIFGPFVVVKIDVNNFSQLIQNLTTEKRQTVVKEIARMFQVIEDEFNHSLDDEGITQSTSRLFLRGDQTADSVIFYFNPRQKVQVFRILDSLKLSSDQFSLQAKTISEERQVLLTGNKSHIIHSSKPIAVAEWESHEAEWKRQNPRQKD